MQERQRGARAAAAEAVVAAAEPHANCEKLQLLENFCLDMSHLVAIRDEQMCLDLGSIKQ